jgi:hypothetical protein
MAKLGELLKAGLINPEEKIIWHRKLQNQWHVAIVTKDGRVKTSDGQIHNSPSKAARHLNAGISINGWRVWKVERLSKTLLELREQVGGTYSRKKLSVD